MNETNLDLHHLLNDLEIHDNFHDTINEEDVQHSIKQKKIQLN